MTVVARIRRKIQRIIDHRIYTEISKKKRKEHEAAEEAYYLARLRYLKLRGILGDKATIKDVTKYDSLGFMKEPTTY